MYVLETGFSLHTDIFPQARNNQLNSYSFGTYIMKQSNIMLHWKNSSGSLIIITVYSRFQSPINEKEIKEVIPF